MTGIESEAVFDVLKSLDSKVFLVTVELGWNDCVIVAVLTSQEISDPLMLCYHSMKYAYPYTAPNVDLSHHVSSHNITSHHMYLILFHQVAVAILEVPSGVSRVHASRRTFQLLADRECMLPVVHSVVFSSLKDKVTATLYSYTMRCCMSPATMYSSTHPSLPFLHCTVT
jgi:hypothetical protein